VCVSPLRDPPMILQIPPIILQNPPILREHITLFPCPQHPWDKFIDHKCTHIFPPTHANLTGTTVAQVPGFGTLGSPGTGTEDTAASRGAPLQTSRPTSPDIGTPHLDACTLARGPVHG